MIAVGLPEEHEAIQHAYKQSGSPLEICEENIIGVAHPELSAQALATWNLPDAIQTAVRFHHRPEQAPPGGHLSLATVIHCADDYINMAGVSVQAEDEILEPSSAEPFAPLGIELASADFVNDFKVELEVLGGVFH